jgi:AcrR family transcriptional regulator
VTEAERRTGRRPGNPDTRQAILDAARNLFADRGYERTTIRGVAAAAAVDPALVHHYFGTKSALFAAVGRPPFEPSELLAGLTADTDRAGYRIAQRVLQAQDSSPQARATLQSLIRAAASQDEAAAALRELFTSTVHAELRRVVQDDTAELRASLIASQIAGLFLGRYIVGFPGLADAEREALAVALAPVIQHYLTGDISQP